MTTAKLPAYTGPDPTMDTVSDLTRQAYDRAMLAVGYHRNGLLARAAEDGQAAADQVMGRAARDADAARQRAMAAYSARVAQLDETLSRVNELGQLARQLAGDAIARGMPLDRAAWADAVGQLVDIGTRYDADTLRHATAAAAAQAGAGVQAR